MANSESNFIIKFWLFISKFLKLGLSLKKILHHRHFLVMLCHSKNFRDSEAVTRGVLRKRCSENMQQIYRRTPTLKCDFNKVAKKLAD